MLNYVTFFGSNLKGSHDVAKNNIYFGVMQTRVWIVSDKLFK